MVRRLLRFAALATMALTMALAPVASSAAVPSATIQIHEVAQLITSGPDAGSALLTVDYSCNSGVFGSSGFLISKMSQPGATGTADIFATCDDQNHTVSLVNKPGPFTPGTATASVNVQNLTQTSFKTVTAEVMVR